MNLIRQLMALGALTLLGFALFVLLFWAGVGGSITILFYRGIALAFAAAMLTGVAALWRSRRPGDSALPIAATALSLSFNICFLVLLPVTVDRSVSVYLLSTIERHGDSGMSPDALQRAFIDGYVVKMRAVDRRIDEQQRSGNLVLGGDGKVHLTPQGQRFIALSRVIARLFGTDPRFVSGSPPPPAAASSSAPDSRDNPAPRPAPASDPHRRS